MTTKNRDWRDVISGLMMIAIGLFVAIWAQTHYRVGLPAAMGPGWFPMYLGYALAGVGAIIAIPAWFRQAPEGSKIVIEWRPMIWITLSIFAFAITVRWIGLVPAIFLQIALSVLGDTKLGIVGTLVLATVMSALCHFVFFVGLGVYLPAFIWIF